MLKCENGITLLMVISKSGILEGMTRHSGWLANRLSLIDDTLIFEPSERVSLCAERYNAVQLVKFAYTE